MRANIDWCSHDYTPSGTTTWAVGMKHGENLELEFVWPPLESEEVYTTSGAVIRDGKAHLELLYPDVQIQWVG